MKDKWKKMRKKYYEDKIFFNVFGINTGLKWTWCNVMDAVLTEREKTNGVPGDIDQGPAIGMADALVELEDEDLRLTE